MGKNVKNGNWGLNSFNGIDIPPSGPSLYLTVDLAFIQGCSVNLCLEADRYFTTIIMFFVTIYWQLKADEGSLVIVQIIEHLHIINGKFYFKLLRFFCFYCFIIGVHMSTYNTA